MKISLSIILVSLASAGCGASPTAPSSRASLTVNTTDEGTRGLLADPVFGITVQLSGANTYSRAVVGGVATFPDIAPDTYRVTTSVEYGYRQFDVITAIVDGPRTLTLPMTAIDDLTVTEVFVDGQGSIAKGGTIDVPSQGIDLHYRGKWQPLKYMWSENFFFDASLDVRFASPESLSRRLGPTEWEIVLRGVVPCIPLTTGSAGAPCEPTFNAGTFRLAMGRSLSFSNIDMLMNRQQSWPLTFRRIP